jgi:hypothetical protein
MGKNFFTFGAYTTLLIALLLWAAFVYLTIELSDRRALYAAEIAGGTQDEESARATQRLRALVRDTRTERDALENVARLDVVVAAETIEAAGSASGASVVVRSATAASLKGAPKGASVKDIRAVEMLVDAEGSLQELLDAVRNFEALPFLAFVGRVDLEERPPAPGTRAADSWHMAARIRIITTSAAGI